MSLVIKSMSSINEDSDSLIIAEGKQQLDINSLDEKSKKEEDLFELSRDDLTLSFQIEEEKRQHIAIEITRQTSELVPKNGNDEAEGNENKRRRKDIFERFKKPQNGIISKIESGTSEDNLLNIFDSIFKNKCGKAEVTSPRQQLVNHNFLRPMTEVTERSKTPSAEKRERLKIFGKKNQQQRQYQGILPSELIQSQVVPFEPPKTKQPDSPIMVKKVSDSINFSLIENRVSVIEGEENLEFSREEMDIKNILESEIFKDELEKEMRESQAREKEEMKKNLKIEEEESVINSQDFSPEKQKVKMPVLPLLQQKEEQPLSMQIEESRVLRSQASIMSISPPMCQDYQQSSNGGFRPQNSMANVNSLSIADLTSAKITVNNKIKPSGVEFRLYESQVIQAAPSVVKVNVFDSQKRMPAFLRQIRKHISIYPNFYSLNNPNNSEVVRIEFQQLFQLFNEAIKLLTKLCEKVLSNKSKKKLYFSQLTNNLTPDFFLQSGWENAFKTDEFEQIKPMQPFEPREWSYQKAKAALSNYQNIVFYYKSKGVRLDVNSDKGRRKYFQIRQKFWDICGNMKLISEDIYTEMIDCLFPQHFHIFLNYLKTQFPPRLSQQTANNLKQLLHLFKTLKTQNDLLLNSQIGAVIHEKISRELKYVLPY